MWLHIFTVWQLKMHEITHKGDMSFTCSKCFKSFAHNFTLRSQERTQIGDRPFACSKFDNLFSESGWWGMKGSTQERGKRLIPNVTRLLHKVVHTWTWIQLNTTWVYLGPNGTTRTPSSKSWETSPHLTCLKSTALCLLENGFSSVLILSCFFKLPLSANELPHLKQANGLSPV